MNPQPFTTPDDFARVLATLPEVGAVATVAAFSKAQRSDWMQVLADRQWLSMDEPFEGTLKESWQEWRDRVKAVGAFIAGITCEQLKEDPRFGAQPEGMGVAVFGAESAFKEAFRKLTEQAMAWHPDEDSSLVDWNEPMGRLLIGAIVLDMPDLVDRIVKEKPQSLEFKLPADELGEEMAQRFVKADNGQTRDLCVYPLFVALQLSRLDCMEKMHSEATATWRLGESRVANTIEIFGLSSLHEHVQPTCPPSVFADALKTCIATCSDKARVVLEAKAEDVLNAFDTWMQPFLPAYAEAGAYDSNARQVLAISLNKGCPQVVEILSNQVHTPSSIMIANAAVASLTDTAEQQEAILVLLRKAVEQERGDDLLERLTRRDEVKGEYLVEPFSSVIRAGYSDVLVKMVEMGADFRSPDQDGVAPAPFDYAMEQHPAMAQVIQAAEARKHALGILAGNLKAPAP